ncbi:hypothetical protein ACMX2H_18350 [Arthrobacter sulfonylureivorans]|uniref:hypothetical protein n=1 Tax=Arthrobacter sulfonylureivorans TaxID=2486855 RepID=UPI0039E40846
MSAAAHEPLPRYYEGSVQQARGAEVISIEPCHCFSCLPHTGSHASAVVRLADGDVARLEHARWSSFTTERKTNA